MKVYKHGKKTEYDESGLDGDFDMNEIMIKQTASDDIRVLPFLFASCQERLMQEGTVLAAFDEEEICGAVGTIPNGNMVEIISLYVEEAYRGKKIGSRLLKEVTNRAKMQGKVKVSSEYFCTEEQNLNILKFLLKNGFSSPIPGNVMYFVPMNALENSVFASQKQITEKIENNILPINELPLSMLERAEIQEYMIPDYVPGNLLKELSLAYISNGEIKTCIIMCETENENLHLHTAFLEDSKYGGILIGLLQKAASIIKEKYSYFQSFTVSGSTFAKRKLIEHLLEGAEVTKRIAYKAEYPLQRSEGFTPVGFYGTLIRMNTLADALAERNIDSRIVVADGAMPYMELLLEEMETSIKIEYEVLGGEEYTGFILHAFYDLSIESRRSEDDGDWKAILQDHMMILEGEEGEFLLWGRYEETSSYDADTSIERFILPFMDCVKKLIHI